MSPFSISDKEGQKGHDHCSDPSEDQKGRIEHDKFDQRLEPSLFVEGAHGLVEIEKEEE